MIRCRISSRKRMIAFSRTQKIVKFSAVSARFISQNYVLSYECFFYFYIQQINYKVPINEHLSTHLSESCKIIPYLMMVSELFFRIYNITFSRKYCSLHNLSLDMFSPHFQDFYCSPSVAVFINHIVDDYYSV